MQRSRPRWTRRPELFPILRVLCDRDPLPARFLALGSASPVLLRQSAESLAGRIEIVTMAGFSLAEVGVAAQARHWQRGGFPLAFLAASDEDSLAWRKNFIQTFLERDLPQLGSALPAASFYRFWSLLAHYHGQVWNAAEAARALDVSESTARRYLDLLEGVFMVRQLRPWYANLAKRQIKSPKVYLRDTGLLHQLLGIRTEQELLLHPKSGASWEGYVIEEVVKAAAPDEVYFWGTHAGAELDLLLIKHGRRLGVECKRMDAPRLTASMQIALHDLALDHLTVIYPGDRPYPVADRVTVVPLAAIATGAP
jgi:predicted AAA+ superfamily ATPase